MSHYEFESFSYILSGCDFSQASVNMFKTLQMTQLNAPIISENDGFLFAYTYLPSDLVILSDERDVMTSISQISHLFDIDEFSMSSPSIRFYSVDLICEGVKRSQVQHTIHTMIARRLPYCSVIITRSDGAISMSVSYHMTYAVKTVFLSDWYELYDSELDNFIINLGTSPFSLMNSETYTDDLVYTIARECYTHQLSYEYIRNELNIKISFLNLIMGEYGNDFIADAYFAACYEEPETAEDVDFDLLEYELEQISNAGLEEFEFDEINDEIEDELSVTGIPEEVLANPILLLKWLDKNSEDMEVEVDSRSIEIVEMIIKADIDYIDHRDNGGFLWIIGEYELEDFVEKCKEIGIVFHYQEGGSLATGGFDAWWSR
jgi:hypothetical protein